MKKEYEIILTNGFSAEVPTEPCWCLYRVKPDNNWPFILVRVRKKWWFFGPLMVGSVYVSEESNPECWRVKTKYPKI